jgi:hypothetical protein
MDGTPHEKVLDKGVVSKLEEIMKPENLPRVQEWYEKRTPKEKREWAAPTTVSAIVVDTKGQHYMLGVDVIPQPLHQ